MRRLTPKQLVRHYGSQRAAGEALGVTQQAVSAWKKKGVIPRSYRLLAQFCIAVDKGVKK
jgi:predicted transcriptional regulator